VVPLILTFQRFIYAHPTTSATVNGQPVIYHVLPTNGPIWYLGLDGAVLACSVILFLIALATFGRLEGNFAEEL
jgi:hypothetical protein